MAKSQSKKSHNQSPQLPQTLGEFAHQVIEQQYQRIIKQEKKVLADKDPEALHQMRVGTRRLRTALQIFETAVELPKAASAKRLRDLARTLGEVRDLDVQLATLKQEYQPNLNKQEQKQLDKVAAALKEQRIEAFAQMKDTLNRSRYQKLKTAYADWLKQPRYTSIAKLPTSALLPDLLAPLLSHLLLHPGWLISHKQSTDENGTLLHELRKACKHARYQAEFFVPFYGEEFNSWIEDVKELQGKLGDFQDTQVFLALSAETLGHKSRLPALEAAVKQKQNEALSNWEETRQKYLDEGFRYHLHQILLRPSVKAGKVHPELIEQDVLN